MIVRVHVSAVAKILMYMDLQLQGTSASSRVFYMCIAAQVHNHGDNILLWWWWQGRVFQDDTFTAEICRVVSLPSSYPLDSEQSSPLPRVSVEAPLSGFRLL